MKNRLVKVESTWVTVSLAETVHSNINRELEKAASSASGLVWLEIKSKDFSSPIIRMDSTAK